MFRLAISEEGAWQLIESHTMCKNCYASKKDLFGLHCEVLEREVDSNDMCENFHSKSKHANYWIDKLVEMAQDFNGTEMYFLGIKK